MSGDVYKLVAITPWVRCEVPGTGTGTGVSTIDGVF